MPHSGKSQALELEDTDECGMRMCGALDGTGIYADQMDDAIMRLLVAGWLMAPWLHGRERKNVNLPGVVVDLPTLTAKDETDLVQWGVPNDIDFIAASFVRKGSDLDYIRKVCGCPP